MRQPHARRIPACAAYGFTYEETPTLKKLRSLQNYITHTAPAIVTKLLTK